MDLRVGNLVTVNAPGSALHGRDGVILNVSVGPGNEPPNAGVLLKSAPSEPPLAALLFRQSELVRRAG